MPSKATEGRKKGLLKVAKYALTLLITILITFLIILLVSDDPGSAIYYLLLGPLTSFRRFGNVIELMIPLIFTGLAVSVMFSAGQFNLIGEGAFFIGGIFAMVMGISVSLPPFLHVLLSILVGGLAAVVANLIPTYLKAKLNADVLVSSLMMNHILLLFGLRILNGYFRDSYAGSLASVPFESSALIPRIIPSTRIHWGLIIALACVVIMHLFLNRTKSGFNLRMLGLNKSFATFSGINTYNVEIYSQLIGAFLAGMGGAVEILGMYTRFEWYKLPGYGWDGVIVAILAKKKPLYVPLAAFVLSYIRIGADIMSRKTDVASELMAIIQGIMIVMIVSDTLFLKIKNKKKEPVVSGEI